MGKAFRESKSTVNITTLNQIVMRPSAYYIWYTVLLCKYSKLSELQR